MGQTGQKKRAQRGGAMRSLGDWIGTTAYFRYFWKNAVILSNGIFSMLS